jgi:hypothetical protein
MPLPPGVTVNLHTGTITITGPKAANLIRLYREQGLLEEVSKPPLGDRVRDALKADQPAYVRPPEEEVS